jgi:dephospho-CoA kinase
MSVSRPPRALALVGMPGSGKTLCAGHLERCGFYQFRFGGIVTDEVARRGLPIIPKNERIVREELRARYGMDAIAQLALPHLKAALEQRDSIVIDGLYSFSEYRTLQPELGNDMVVVAIACPRHIRYERLASRAERPLTRQEAIERDYLEIETLEKGGPIAIADYTLVNDGEPGLLLEKLDTLLLRLGLKP